MITIPRKYNQDTNALTGSGARCYSATNMKWKYCKNMNEYGFKHENDN